MIDFNLDNLPRFEIVSSLILNSSLANLDPDPNLPIQSNFKYYTTDEFHNSTEIRNCSTTFNHQFSVMHSNIRSLSANFDSLNELLSELNYNFSLIGLTETKILTMCQY